MYTSIEQQPNRQGQNESDYLESTSLDADRERTLGWRPLWHTSNRLIGAVGQQLVSSRILRLVLLISVFFIMVIPILVVRHQYRSHRRVRLKFDANQHFKILQLTDLHLGEEPSSGWGPAGDRKTLQHILQWIDVEKPNLIVLGGDQITANNIDSNATVYYDTLANSIQEKNIPYALIFGNHDDTDLEEWLDNGTMIKHRCKTSRRQLLRSDQRHEYSLTQEGPGDIFGVSNYILDVYQESKVRLQIVMLDSGGGSLDQDITKNQMDWYQRNRLTDVDAVAFQHIPTQQFQFTTECQGFQGEGIAPLQEDPTDEVMFLLEQDPRLHFLAVGHNHGDSYCCPTTNLTMTNKTDSALHLCFGRHSGWGGYGSSDWLKGARVFDIIAPLTILEDGKPCMSDLTWRSWVRLETSNVTDEYQPNT